MRTFFDIEGLHFQPENPEEQAAIRLLWENASRVKSPIGGARLPSSVFIEKINESVVANH